MAVTPIAERQNDAIAAIEARNRPIQFATERAARTPVPRGGRVAVAHGLPTRLEAEAIAAVKEHGDMVSAAIALGVSRKTVNLRLLRAKSRDVVFDWPTRAPRSMASETIPETIPLAEPRPTPESMWVADDSGPVFGVDPHWPEITRRRYIELLLEKAANGYAPDSLFDRIERLLGLAA